MDTERLFPIARSLCASAALAYLFAAALLWSYQAHLIFEPERGLRHAAGEFAFPVHDVQVPLAGPSGQQERLHGWWIPSDREDAKVVLYLHGNDGNVSTSMAGVAPLRELGYSVFLVDYRGYGKSSGGFPTEATVYEDAEAAWEHLVRRHAVHPGRLYIYGHSLGGAIAIELALRHPEAAGLIVESSFTSIYDMAMLSKTYALLPVRPFLRQKFESLEKVAGLSLPVLYIHGTRDETVPFAMGEQLFSRSGGAKRFLAIEGGGHEDNAAAGGAGLRAALSQFIH